MAAKTLICELRDKGGRVPDGGLTENQILERRGTDFEILMRGDEGPVVLVMSTFKPIPAAARALAKRGHKPGQLFALVDHPGGQTRCVLTIDKAFKVY